MQNDTNIQNPFTFQSQDIAMEPFPHIIKDGFIEPSLYSRLKQEYPSDEMFDRSSSAGARAGRDIYRGDANYETLLASSPAWHELHSYMNSARFVEQILSLFGNLLSRYECYTDPELAHFIDYVEPREELKQRSRVVQKIQETFMRFSKPKHVNELAVRMDLGQAGTGYYKSVHCDRPNRLITMIVYFCDADQLDTVGGDLGIHELIDKDSKKSFSEYPRHPHPGETREIARLRPRENLGILFPCTNNSYHSVEPIEKQNGYRNFIYCSVYSKGNSIWNMRG